MMRGAHYVVSPTTDQLPKKGLCTENLPGFPELSPRFSAMSVLDWVVGMRVAGHRALMAGEMANLEANSGVCLIVDGMWASNADGVP
jgi:hypothetical protein